MRGRGAVENCRRERAQGEGLVTQNLLVALLPLRFLDMEYNVSMHVVAYEELDIKKCVALAEMELDWQIRKNVLRSLDVKMRDRISRDLPQADEKVVNLAIMSVFASKKIEARAQQYLASLNLPKLELPHTSQLANDVRDINETTGETHESILHLMHRKAVAAVYHSQKNREEIVNDVVRRYSPAHARILLVAMDLIERRRDCWESANAALMHGRSDDYTFPFRPRTVFPDDAKALSEFLKRKRGMRVGKLVFDGPQLLGHLVGNWYVELTTTSEPRQYECTRLRYVPRADGAVQPTELVMHGTDQTVSVLQFAASSARAQYVDVQPFLEKAMKEVMWAKKELLNLRFMPTQAKVRGMKPYLKEAFEHAWRSAAHNRRQRICNDLEECVERHFAPRIQQAIDNVSYRRTARLVPHGHSISSSCSCWHRRRTLRMPKATIKWTTPISSLRYTNLH